MVEPRVANPPLKGIISPHYWKNYDFLSVPEINQKVGFNRKMTLIIAVFLFVYFGMMLGKIPGLALDRTGVALLGAIIFITTGKTTVEEAWSAVDIGTIALLFGLMVISAQFRLGGFYTALTRRLADMKVSPKIFLAMIILTSAFLSAVLANDVICLAMTPILVEGCAKRKLNPVPFLLALTCSSNIGSAATIIGNPQNMLIGQVLKLDFVEYLKNALPPSIISLFFVWLVIWAQYRNKLEKDIFLPPIYAPPFNPWQTTKGIVVLVTLVGAFLFTNLRRDVLALMAAGILLSSRKMTSKNTLSLVDWQLLMLFIGLFVVNNVLEKSSLMKSTLNIMSGWGINPSHPPTLFVLTVLLSNLVSNVPAVMLLLPTAVHPLSGPIMALSSTFAGNLLVVGSIANIIVIDQALYLNVEISWAEHAKTGVPITVLSLLLAGGWLAIVNF